jgi:hypothetical protein
MTHILRITGETTPPDMPAAVLAIFTRGGHDSTGGDVRRWREDLAEAVGPGELADLLRGPEAIEVVGRSVRRRDGRVSGVAQVSVRGRPPRAQC